VRASPPGGDAGPSVSQRSPSPKLHGRAYWAMCATVLRRIQFIQCGGDSATDLQAVRYRFRANWIGPEPDSVLRSVRSLISIVCLVVTIASA